jgi:hypothetical protein
VHRLAALSVVATGSLMKNSAGTYYFETKLFKKALVEHERALEIQVHDDVSTLI